MMEKLQLIFFMAFVINAYSQTPEITGDTMLCANDNGTAYVTGSQTYDSYQWYYKYWFTNDDYESIAGATEATVTYDWYTYDQALLKVVVTLDGVSYESNSIQIDSWAYSTLSVDYDLGENATYDSQRDLIFLCQGTSLDIEIFDIALYNTNIQWYKDNVPIEGANQAKYSITTGGFYQVSAAPDFCPNNISTSIGVNIVLMDNCNLDVNDLDKENTFQIYPNPAKNELNLTLSYDVYNEYKIIDLRGKIILKGLITSSKNNISLLGLNNGVYILKLIGENVISTKKLVKE